MTQSHLFNNYSPQKISFKKGDGCFLTDEHDAVYLDALSGISVTNLGHNHPEISKVISQQAKTLIHTSNLYQIKQQQQLAYQLSKLSKMKKAFFANSGAEANEAAIKLTRLYAKKHNIKQPIILTAHNSFHGRSIATLSASGNDKIKQGFEPLVQKFIHIEYNNIEALKKHSNNPDVVAVMLEPVLGEAGVIIPKKDYLNKVHLLCQKNNWLLILDEIQTGNGRCGKWYCHQYNNITPDILTTAKGLANGLPIGVCLGGQKVADLFTPGTHGSTFGGNPLVCQVALKALEIIDNGVLENTNKMAHYFNTKAKQKLLPLNQVKNIRNIGLMIGITLDKIYDNVMQKALDEQLLISINKQHIRLLPPLIIKQKEMDLLINKLYQLISKL